MSDTEVLNYLLSNAPLDHFYLFMPRGDPDTIMIKFFDSTGRTWSLMEDNDELVVRATAFLKASGAKVLETLDELNQYESELRRRN